jgi:hypothetical protein
MTMKILNGTTWKDATPKGVLIGTTWKTPTAVHVLQDGAWKKVWPDAAPVPDYLYDCTSVASAGYVVDFTVLDGWPEGDVNEVYMFRCSTMTGYNGYVGRNFQKTFGPSGYGSYDCTLEDLSSIPGKTRQTISFKCYPKA